MIKNKEKGGLRCGDHREKMTGKRCAGITKLHISDAQKVTELTLARAQLKYKWSHPILTSSAGTR